MIRPNDLVFTEQVSLQVPLEVGLVAAQRAAETRWFAAGHSLVVSEARWPEEPSLAPLADKPGT